MAETLKEKLLAIQAELNAPKNLYNSFGKYHYRSCEGVLEALKPLLKKHKASIKISDDIEVKGDRYYVHSTIYFYHAEKISDKDEDVQMIMAEAYAREPESKTGMDSAQITGTASSYARKYALNGLFLIDDAKDPDTDEYHVTTEAKKDKKVTQIKKKPDSDADASDLDKFVTDEQLKTLEMLLKKADVTPEKFCDIYKLTIMSELPADKYADAVGKLEIAVKAHKSKEKEGE